MQEYRGKHGIEIEVPVMSCDGKDAPDALQLLLGSGDDELITLHYINAGEEFTLVVFAKHLREACSKALRIGRALP